MNRTLRVCVLLSGLTACVFRGGGQTHPDRKATNPADVALPEGYRIEVVAEGLDFPTGIAFDEQGTAYVVEGGYSYGEVFTTPRIVELTSGGGRRTVYEGKGGPWNGITYARGRFYVADGNQQAPGRIIEVDKNGQLREVVTGLPSMGDHHTDGPAVGPDGMLYWGQGAATNSGVVGEDDADFGWLERFPKFHDVPCQDITLAGHNFTSKNPLSDDENAEATTGAYLPFGTPSTAGQVIKGELPCTGAVLRTRLDAAAGAPIELVAWGFRNPFGLAFHPDGSLYVTDNGFDERGSRPVFGAGDMLWKVEKGRWYGWPDFSGARALDTQRFDSPKNVRPKRLLVNPPGEVPEPVALFAVHSSSNGLDISRSEQFGHKGQAFVAQFGDTAPAVGNVVRPVGFRVVRVNLETGVIADFAMNAGMRTGPASYLNTGGLERPIAARFNPDGSALYVVDFGVLTVKDQVLTPQRGSGRVWRISHE